MKTKVGQVEESGCVSDSFDDDGCSSSSSSKDVFGSFSSKWLTMKKDEHGLNDWDLAGSPQHLYDKEKPCYSIQYSDVETMKEKFAKLLLGEDITGGRSGLSTALALSNAITKSCRYNCLLKQNCANGRILEIMTPKARADIHVNLPALQKLDSMLIDTLDAMVNTEFWYSEVGSRAEGRTKSAKQSKRWWLPLPQVPTTGLSDPGRKKLLNQSKVVYQVFKAAKSVNENILLEMPVPAIIKDALTKSGKANLGEELYKVLTADSNTAAEMLNSLNLKSEHSALDAINKLEAAIFAWKERVTAQASGRSPVRTSWSFVKDSMSEFDKMESLLDSAESLVQLLKSRYPNLPQTFLDSTKVQYGKDVGHAILEAYSRVLGNVAFSILSRIADIMQEDSLTNPSSPAATCCFPGGVNSSGYLETPVHALHVRHSLIDEMNKVDGKCRESNASHISDQELSYSEARTSSVVATPSRSRVWCIGGDACRSLSPANSPLTERSRGI
ncbi:hypothetical protein OIU84_022394 [Salix udensis]|uniref:PRONE domain-containing protein n=1 Tax=Salix udensis TaxID=889485 RepID=A0AAD6PFP2_9ROSI|nr:hypothetical protein OIU84_022394 [Salix udensis]